MIVSAAESGQSKTCQTDGSPKVEHAENQSDHDQIPGTVSNGPGSEKEFGNPMQSGADSDVFKHQQAMSQQEQPTGHASHQDLPRPAQILLGEKGQHLKGDGATAQGESSA